MANGSMLHIKETLNADQRVRLRGAIRQRFGCELALKTSRRPHLFFVSAACSGMPPTALLQLVRDQGYQARVVDL